MDTFLDKVDIIRKVTPTLNPFYKQKLFINKKGIADDSFMFASPNCDIKFAFEQAVVYIL